MADIARNIKQLRMQREMSQAQLAEKVGVTRQTISGWERGVSFPDIDMLEKLSEILETDISDLLYPHKVKQKKSGLGRSFEQISPKFILWSVIFYFILLVWGGMLIGCPLFGKIVGGGIEEEFLYIIYWGLILLVGYIAFCVCLLSENMARFLNEEAVDDKKAEDKTEDQDWDDKACQN